MKKPHALIVDDEPSICDTLSGVLIDEGWKTVTANSGMAGLEQLKAHPVDVVFLDVWMKEMDGIETLQLMKEIRPHIPVVIMSGLGSIETAVKVTKLGAFDFLEKPLSIEKIIPVLEHTLALRGKGRQGTWDYQLVGESPAVGFLHRRIKLIAPRNSWVLISGENGTGKEVVARNIHLHSRRAERPFVAVNCAAIPEDLIESELFGYDRGAFTNALGSKPGKFELAHQGTLFLDEIGDMSLKTQAKILRILQEQAFERLGGNKLINIDVRVIAATNKDLQEEIRCGSFREDLFYRLNVIPIQMTPLRERTGDIEVLVSHFSQRMAQKLGEPVKCFTQGIIHAFRGYRWPGNVRELENVIERLCILIPEVNLERKHLLEFLPDMAFFDEVVVKHKPGDTLREARSNFERAFLIDKLKENEWNISKTAESIGLERSNLHRKLKSYDIDMKSFSGGQG